MPSTGANVARTHRRRRVKWPSERSEWLLDAAAALTQSNPTATSSGGHAKRSIFFFFFFFLLPRNVIQLTPVGRKDC